jgi:hypothetical protein
VGNRDLLGRVVTAQAPLRRGVIGLARWSCGCVAALAREIDETSGSGRRVENFADILKIEAAAVAIAHDGRRETFQIAFRLDPGVRQLQHKLRDVEGGLGERESRREIGGKRHEMALLKFGVLPFEIADVERRAGRRGVIHGEMKILGLEFDRPARVVVEKFSVVEADFGDGQIEQVLAPRRLRISRRRRRKIRRTIGRDVKVNRRMLDL